MSNPHHFTRENFEEEVLRSEKPVIVDFWASWCGPCIAMAPVFEELAQEYHKTGRAKLGKYSTEEDAEIPARYGVRGIPTLMIFYKGQKAGEIVGFGPKDIIRARIEEVLEKLGIE